MKKDLKQTEAQKPFHKTPAAIVVGIFFLWLLGVIPSLW